MAKHFWMYYTVYSYRGRNWAGVFLSLKQRLINEQVLPKHFVWPPFVDKKKLEQKHTFKRQTDSSWWFPTRLKNMRKSHWIILSWIGVKVQKKCLETTTQIFMSCTPQPSASRNPVFSKAHGSKKQFLSFAFFVGGERKWPVFELFCWSCCFSGVRTQNVSVIDCVCRFGCSC